ncbi:SDR family NAD(P)-dependent oxidoreductase [Rhodococcus sp. HNM0569]|uniref:SDR family NAD(P)-dependent oxidoreductase n=1 Tax=Rhodococcus sp. HNM0569 TaxID=2716340 RepID=UPI00146E7584|nr:SDR family NAD(P)-dependent oxidoreductase [Rhodococcus sp. HNM0569]NLU84579.1 SDR family oxidoreductase [Rhodococcus sp. HNM0569]
MHGSDTQREFDGSTVVVTGAGSGMGRVEARLLAARGATVWVTDVDGDAATAVADEIGHAGADARVARLDVTSAQSWNDLADAIGGDPVVGLVNNAGVSHRYGILDTTLEDWERVLAVNLSSVFLGMKTVAPLMTGGGSIVNISSIAGMLGYFAAGYGATKWGVRGLSKVGALEFAERGVRVNSVHPGLVDTPLLNSGSDVFVDESLRAVPAGRVASSEEVAEVVAFLLSPRSGYVSGTEIVVDGGLTSGGIYHRITSDLASARS